MPDDKSYWEIVLACNGPAALSSYMETVLVVAPGNATNEEVEACAKELEFGMDRAFVKVRMVRPIHMVAETRLVVVK